MPAPVTFPPGGTSWAFIVSEHIYRSREEGVVASGSGILPGGALMSQQANGTYIPWVTGATNCALLCEDVDATSAAVKRTFIVRDAEVQRAALFFSGTPTNTQKNEAYALLSARGVTLR